MATKSPQANGAARPTSASARDEIIAADVAHLWHPFTQMKLWPDEPPLVIARGEGNWLFDIDGQRYFDGVSSLWVTVHGHCHPEINRAIVAQLETLDHSTLLGLTHPPAAKLAAKLAAIAPEGLTKVFYSECGSAAVEIALKMAFQYWQHLGQPKRQSFVALQDAYHGDTIGSVSVGGMSLFHGVYGPLLFKCHRLPQPHCRTCRLGMRYPSCDLACAEALEPMLQAHGKEICAVVIEPKVQGASGMIIQPEGYMSRIAAISKRHGIPLIADEVATGFGRTGPMFACELEGIKPDLMCLGKGLTGGMLPLAATLATEPIFNAFLGEYTEYKTLFHGHTYTGNPLACAAALCNLELFETNHVQENVAARTEQLKDALAEIAQLPHVQEIRQQGLMCGIALALDPAAGTPFPSELRLGHRVCMAARAHEVIVRPLGDTIVLMPPLSTSALELSHLLRGVRQAIIDVTTAAARSR